MHCTRSAPPAPLLSSQSAASALPHRQLSKLVLKGMRARRRGVVINVGSGVSTVIPASPLLSGAQQQGFYLLGKVAAHMACVGSGVPTAIPAFSLLSGWSCGIPAGSAR